VRAYRAAGGRPCESEPNRNSVLDLGENVTTQASVRPPKQRRSQPSLERVLAAATLLLEEKGFDAFTIQE
jgi:hypothetical protein